MTGGTEVQEKVFRKEADGERTGTTERKDGDGPSGETRKPGGRKESGENRRTTDKPVETGGRNGWKKRQSKTGGTEVQGKVFRQEANGERTGTTERKDGDGPSGETRESKGRKESGENREDTDKPVETGGRNGWEKRQSKTGGTARQSKTFRQEMNGERTGTSERRDGGGPGGKTRESEDREKCGKDRKPTEKPAKTGRQEDKRNEGKRGRNRAGEWRAQAMERTRRPGKTDRRTAGRDRNLPERGNGEDRKNRGVESGTGDGNSGRDKNGERDRRNERDRQDRKNRQEKGKIKRSGPTDGGKETENGGFVWAGERLFFPQEAHGFEGRRIPMASLSAEEFCEATDLYIEDKWGHAPLIVAALCRPEGERYDERKVCRRAGRMGKIPMGIVLRLYAMLERMHREMKERYPLCYASAFRDGGQEFGRKEATRWTDMMMWAGHHVPSEVERAKRMNVYDFVALVHSRMKMRT